MVVSFWRSPGGGDGAAHAAHLLAGGLAAEVFLRCEHYLAVSGLLFWGWAPVACSGWDFLDSTAFIASSLVVQYLCPCRNLPGWMSASFSILPAAGRMVKRHGSFFGLPFFAGRSRGCSFSPPLPFPERCIAAAVFFGTLVSILGRRGRSPGHRLRQRRGSACRRYPVRNSGRFVRFKFANGIVRVERNPVFFNHWDKVTSVMDSPMVGTFIFLRSYGVGKWVKTYYSAKYPVNGGY